MKLSPKFLTLRNAAGARIGIRFPWNPALCLRSVRASTAIAHAETIEPPKKKRDGAK